MKLLSTLMLTTSLAAAAPVVAIATEAETGDNSQVFNLLAAEMALDRGVPSLALNFYLHAAETTKDAAIAEQATGIALDINDVASAIKAATIWADNANDSIEAQQTITSLMIQTGLANDSIPYLKKILQFKESAPEKAVAAISSSLEDSGLRPQLIKALETIGSAKEFAQQPSLHICLGIVYVHHTQLPEAHAAFSTALKIDPSITRAIILLSEVLSRQNKIEDAFKLLTDKVAQSPQDHDLIMFLAEKHMEYNQIPPARELLVRIKDIPTTMGPANIYLGQMLLFEKQYQQAQQSFETALAHDEYANTAKFFLAKVFEEQQQLEQAIAWYTKISEGEYHITAHILAAALAVRDENHSRAVEILQMASIETLGDLKQIQLAQAEVLTAAAEVDKAYAALTEALKHIPYDVDLLYSRALTALNLKQFPQFEADLVLVLQVSPNHLNALNTLGFALADFTSRFEEAEQYLNKAMEIAPNNPSVLDSMGWLYYKRGNFNKAKQLLTRAYNMQPDLEIAMHLTQALWALGEKSEVKSIMAALIKQFPENEALQQLDNKFTLKADNGI